VTPPKCYSFFTVALLAAAGAALALAAPFPRDGVLSFLAVNASSKSGLLGIVPVMGPAEPKAERDDLIGVLGEPGIEPPLLGRLKSGRVVGRPEADVIVWEIG